MKRDCTGVEVRPELLSIYGAVAAVLRDDQEGIGLMLHEVSELIDDTADLLVTIAAATIEQLRVVAAHRNTLTPLDDLIVLDLVITANSYDLASRLAVAAGADRLAVVHTGARPRAVDTSATGDSELVRGAIATLAAAVEIVAASTGRATCVAAADLCLSVAVATLP